MVRESSEEIEVHLRVRVSTQDTHYAGDLVDGAWILSLFGDLATEICVRCDGDEGLFRAYQEIEFLSPVKAGDFIEARARLVGVGKSSRRIEFVAEKQVSNDPDRGVTSACLVDPPQPVAKATGVVVVPESRQKSELSPGSGS